jgi:ATP-binding cassette, subfamily G (WHITE), member 2, SNQ2
MHPWLKWLIWINPVQYAFEALMANEFYNLNIQCVPPSLVPEGPNATPQHQSCFIQGSQTDQTIVRGSNYIEAAYTYSRSHLWRNFGIIIAWLIFFVVLTMIGMELQKPNTGGSAVTIFKRGQVPRGIDDAIKNKKTTSGDEEAADGTQNSSDIDNNNTEDRPAEDEEAKSVEGIANNTAIFTWQNVNYDIQAKGGTKRLLSDVQGYVRPGRLTAMMGASGAG